MNTPGNKPGIKLHEMLYGIGMVLGAIVILSTLKQMFDLDVDDRMVTVAGAAVGVAVWFRLFKPKDK